MNNHINILVGNRLRLRRTMLGMTQEQLGAAAGVTFQQIQKYEKGQNGIGCSKLYEFAKILNIGVEFFFQDAFDENDTLFVKRKTKDEKSRLEYLDYADSKEIFLLVKAYNCIKDLKIRKHILSLIKVLSIENNFEEETRDY